MEYPGETPHVRFGDDDSNSHAPGAGIEPASLRREVGVQTTELTGQH